MTLSLKELQENAQRAANEENRRVMVVNLNPFSQMLVIREAPERKTDEEIRALRSVVSLHVPNGSYTPSEEF